MELPCPQCQAMLSIPDQMAGSKIRCSRCSAFVDVSALPNAEDPFAFAGEAAPGGDFAFASQTTATDRRLQRRRQGTRGLLLAGLGYAAFVNCVYAVGLAFQFIVMPDSAAYHGIPFQRDASYLWGRALAMLLVYGLWLTCSLAVPGFFVYRGAQAILAMRARGWVIGAAIGTFLLGLQGGRGVLRGLLSLLPGTVTETPETIEQALDHDFYYFYLLAGLLCLIQVLLCTWAGIRVLLLLATSGTGQQSPGSR